VSLSTDSTGHAVIRISDTGEGIPPEILPSIFDPFFTTKPIGVGTGLGLSICRNIILKINGDLRVESRVGFGTTIHIVLPPAKSQSLIAPVSAFPKVSELKNLKVLILDDEVLLGISMVKGLGSAHRVHATTSPIEALKLVQDTAYDVIFCDLMMEEMTGMDFFEELRRLHPGLESRVIFMTGGVFTKRASQFLETVPNLRILKPFNLKEIRTLLQTGLSQIKVPA
jgi:CheY-like chemotaxis protein